MLYHAMRVIARSVLIEFSTKHPEAATPLERWYRLAKASRWQSMEDVRKTVPKAKILNRERVRFEVAGGNYRLVVAFDFRRQIAFVKFLGSHADYDSIDAMTVSQF
jgi:mRNA interferase HigB